MLFKKDKTTESQTGVASANGKVMTIVGIVLCVLLVPILVFNCTMIVKGWVNKDEVPSIGGVSPLIVLTDSMDPVIKSGDIILTKQIEGEDVVKGDVISFFDPAGNGTSVVTHRVVDIKTEKGEIFFQTKGDANNIEDRRWVSENALVGKWTERRIPLVGHVALFMQSTVGLLLCIFLPLALFVGYDVMRRRKQASVAKDDVAALKAELEALKAEKNNSSD